MSATDSRKRVLAPAALGLALAVLCHPDVASAAVAFLGETPRRALPLDHLGALARNHLALAGLGLLALERRATRRTRTDVAPHAMTT